MNCITAQQRGRICGALPRARATPPNARQMRRTHGTRVLASARIGAASRRHCDHLLRTVRCE
eukprot:6034961-Lingulodinium_polyedra.AAC.1